MSYGPISIFTISMASGETLSTALTMPRAWNQIHVEIPSMASGTDIFFKVSSDGTTYRRIFHTPTITNAAPAAFYLNSSVTNCHVDLDHRWIGPYVKIELGTAMTATPATFKIIAYSP